MAQKGIQHSNRNFQGLPVSRQGGVTQSGPIHLPDMINHRIVNQRIMRPLGSTQHATINTAVKILCSHCGVFKANRTNK
jgi:hypothetical protein